MVLERCMNLLEQLVNKNILKYNKLYGNLYLGHLEYQMLPFFG